MLSFCDRKVASALERWNLFWPTLYSKRNISQLGHQNFCLDRPLAAKNHWDYNLWALKIIFGERNEHSFCSDHIVFCSLLDFFERQRVHALPAGGIFGWIQVKEIGTSLSQ